MTGNPDLADRNASEQVVSMNEQMEALALAGEWNQVADLVIRRNAKLLELKGSERKGALLAARRSTEQIRSMANSARKVVAKKLTDLARGKKATDSYRSHA